MKESSDGFVRADQIDLKSIDEQLERHLNKALTMDRKKRVEEEEEDGDDDDDHHHHVRVHATSSATTSPKAIKFKPSLKKQKQEWEIDPSKLIIKSVIARGTFGTVHRGIYDAQDVAGEFFFPPVFGINFTHQIQFRCLIPCPSK